MHVFSVTQIERDSLTLKLSARGRRAQIRPESPICSIISIKGTILRYYGGCWHPVLILRKNKNHRILRFSTNKTYNLKIRHNKMFVVQVYQQEEKTFFFYTIFFLCFSPFWNSNILLYFYLYVYTLNSYKLSTHYHIFFSFFLICLVFDFYKIGLTKRNSSSNISI